MDRNALLSSAQPHSSCWLTTTNALLIGGVVESSMLLLPQISHETPQIFHKTTLVKPLNCNSKRVVEILNNCRSFVYSLYAAPMMMLELLIPLLSIVHVASEVLDLQILVKVEFVQLMEI